MGKSQLSYLALIYSIILITIDICEGGGGRILGGGRGRDHGGEGVHGGK